MIRTCVDSALEDLQWLESDRRLTFTMKHQIKTLKMELRFFRVFLLYMENWTDVRANARFQSLPRIIEAALSNSAQGLYATDLLAMHKIKVKDWELLVSNLVEKINHLKPIIREACDVLSKCTLQIKSPVSAEFLLELLDPLLENLNGLVALRVDMILPLKKQIEGLESRLKFLRSFVSFTSEHCHENEKLADLLTHVGAVLSNAACLSYLCWIDEIDESTASGINAMLSDLLQNLKPNTSEVIEMYLGLLSASKTSVSCLRHKVVVSFVDFLLENLMVHMKDQIEVLHEGLVLLIVYLIDPLEEDRLYRKKMLKLVEVVVSEARSLITYSYKIDMTTEETETEVSVLLSKLQEKVNFIKVEVFLMELLRCNSTWMASVKDHIDALHEGLRFLIVFLMDPPKKSTEDGELMYAHMEEVANEAGSLIDSIDGDQMTESLVGEMNLVLVKFFEHIKLIKQVEFLMELLNGKASRLVPEKHITGSLDVDLSFLKAFLMDLPEEYKSEEKLIFTQIEAVVNETVSFLCSKDNKAMEESTLTKMNLLLSVMLEKIMFLKAELHEIYLQVPRSSMSTFPMTDGVGFVDSQEI